MKDFVSIPFLFLRACNIMQFLYFVAYFMQLKYTSFIRKIQYLFYSLQLFCNLHKIIVQYLCNFTLKFSKMV